MIADWLLTFIADVIFFIFLYQRWIYRVDPKRINEFGTSQEMLENPTGQCDTESISPGTIATADDSHMDNGQGTKASKSLVEKKID